MIYKSLDKLPIKILLEIYNTGDVRLLTDDDETDIQVLNELWAKLDKEYKNLNPSQETTQVLKLCKEISAYQNKYKSIIFSCAALSFDYEEELIELLKGYGYKLSDEDYHEDLLRIEREAKALLIKAEKLREMLPDTDNVESPHIDEILARYSMIVGFDFDYNVISVTKFLALQKQVSLKIKALEKTNAK